ncbi:hypothetical protein ACJQWK_11099 [Exserohilum turcicum]
MLRPGMEDVGVSMLSEVHTFVQPLLAQDPGLTAAKATKDVYEWCDNGAKPNVFVSQFSPGCIFVLANQLSANFIKKNKIARSGTKLKAAVSYLEFMLQLSVMLKTPKAGKLGEAIREFLIRPFRQKHEGIDLPAATSKGVQQPSSAGGEDE